MGVGSVSLLLSEPAGEVCFFADGVLASIDKDPLGDFALTADADFSPETENGLAGLMDFTAVELPRG